MAGPFYSNVGGGTAGPGPASTVVTIPTHAAGDWLFTIITTVQGASPSIINAQGFTLLTPAVEAGVGNAGVRLSIYHRRATAAGHTGMTVGHASHYHTRAMVIKGPDPTLALTNIITSTNGAGSAITLPDITTTRSESLVVYFTAHDGVTQLQTFAAGPSAISSLTERVDAQGATGGGSSQGVATGTMTVAGVVGVPTCTTSAGINAGVSIAVEIPAPVARFKALGTANVVGGLGVAGSFSWPAGHAAGDLGVLCVNTANDPPAAPAGWTLVPGTGVGQGTPNTAGAVCVTAFYKFAASSAEPAVTTAAVADFISGRIVTLIGIDPGNPIDVVAVSNPVSAASMAIPGATPTEADTLQLLICAFDRDITTDDTGATWTNTGLCSVVKRGGGATSVGTGGGIAIGTANKSTAAVFGNTTSTLAAGQVTSNVVIVFNYDPGLVYEDGLAEGYSLGYAEGLADGLEIALGGFIISNITPIDGDIEPGEPGAFSATFKTARLTPIAFHLSGIPAGLEIAISVKYGDRNETYTARDCEGAFVWPFDVEAHNTLIESDGGAVADVEIMPRGGWPPTRVEFKCSAAIKAVQA